MANENDEPVAEPEVEETEKSEEKTKADKPIETLEQKKARLARQLKQVNKQLGEEDDEPAPSKKDKEPADLDYSQKAYLRSAIGLKGADEISLARDFMKRAGVSADALEDDDIFMGKLQRLRDTKSNELAADQKSRGTSGGGKDDPAYWLAKLGPTDAIPDEVPRELRFKIVEARRKASKDGKKFYNDK